MRETPSLPLRNSSIVCFTQESLREELRNFRQKANAVTHYLCEGTTPTACNVEAIACNLKGKFTQKESWSEMKEPTKTRRTPLTVRKYLV